MARVHAACPTLSSADFVTNTRYFNCTFSSFCKLEFFFQVIVMLAILPREAWSEGFAVPFNHFLKIPMGSQSAPSLPLPSAQYL